MRHGDFRDAPGLLAETIGSFSSLVQNELALARAEMARNLSRAGTGVACFALAALLGVVALNLLASAVVAWIAGLGLSPGLAALIVGGALLLVALALAFAGKARLSADALRPDRTVANLSRDIDTLKETRHA